MTPCGITSRAAIIYSYIYMGFLSWLMICIRYSPLLYLNTFFKERSCVKINIGPYSVFACLEWEEFVKEWCRKYVSLRVINLSGYYFCIVDRYIMAAMACQITSLTIVYSTVYSGTDQRKHQSSTSLAFVSGIHRGPVNSRTNGQ